MLTMLKKYININFYKEQWFLLLKPNPVRKITSLNRISSRRIQSLVHHPRQSLVPFKPLDYPRIVLCLVHLWCFGIYRRLDVSFTQNLRGATRPPYKTFISSVRESPRRIETLTPGHIILLTKQYKNFPYPNCLLSNDWKGKQQP